MNRVSLSRVRPLLLRTSTPIALLIWLLVVSVVPMCRAETVSPAPTAAPAGDKADSSAVQKASLGDYAEMVVPKGYHFIGGEDAHAWMARMGNPLVPGLAGILAPNNTKWFAVLEFDQIGFVKDLNIGQADLTDILKTVQEKGESELAQKLRPYAPRVASLDWEIKPQYDANAHSLEWAFVAETESGKVVNHSIELFGRRGVLNVTVVEPYGGSERPGSLVQLSDLVKGITFREDYRYSDYQDGDKVASANLKDIIISDNDNNGPSETTPQKAGLMARFGRFLTPSIVIPVGAGLGGLLIVGTGMLVFRGSRKRTVRAAAGTNGYAPAPALRANGNTNGNANGNGKARSHRSAPGQRKIFNYSKFYSEMLMKCSGSNYAWITPVNGNGNGHGNGNINGNGHSRIESPLEPAATQTPITPQQSIANANAELILCQRRLIEEQNNILREQARLIEEKAKLIKEYNQLMDKWSENMENMEDQFSLKLD